MEESYEAFCECDYDGGSEFVSVSVRKARKQHRCGECGGKIHPGETYEYAAGKQEGDMWANSTCPRCLALIEYIKAHVPCFCRMYGGLFEDDARFDEMLFEARQTPGFEFGILRHIVKIRAGKQPLQGEPK